MRILLAWMLVSGLTMSAAAQATEPVFIDAHNGVQPTFRYRLDASARALALNVQVGTTLGADSPPMVDVGVAASRAAMRRMPVQPIETAPMLWQGSLEIPWSELGEGGEPEAVRLAVQVRWFGQGRHQPVRWERYLVSGRHSPFAKFSVDDSADWEKIDLDAHRLKTDDLRNVIALDLEQPMDGKMTVVIEDSNGRRIRNLVSGAAASAGAQRIVWDGCDEDGNLVAPGAYTWRSAHHPGIVAKYLRMYANGREPGLQPFASNHNWFRDACANTNRFFVAAANAEGGYAMIGCNAAGDWLSGYNFPHGTPHGAAVVAADDAYLYAANAGADTSRDQENARHNPDWAGPHFVTLTRFDIASCRVVQFPGKARFHRIFEYEASRRDPLGLNGLALLGDRLYVANRPAGGLLVFDKGTGDPLGKIEVPDVGDVAASGDGLLVISGDRVLRVALPSGKATALTKGRGHALCGLSTDARGNFYVSDNTDHQIVAYTAKGREIRRYGIGGGPYAGAYAPARLVRPQGTAVFGDKLVVTEDRQQPKRFLQFDLADGAVADERFGNPPYGGSGGGFDSLDPTRWIGMGCEWTIDPRGSDEKAAPRPVGVFFADEGHFGGHYDWAYRYRYEHREGRTFLVGSGFIQTVSELRADGSLRDLAAFAPVASWRYGCGWRPPQSFLDALASAGIENPADGKVGGRGVLWTDLNGDGLCQANEFDVLDVDWRCSGSRWGFNSQGLDFTFGVDIDGKTNVLVNLAPQGWHTSGAPRYPALRAAIDAAPRIAPDVFKQTTTAESTVDRFGVTLQNGDPWMAAYDREGKLRWRFLNQWVGVHGSHRAPLPEAGVMQGNLFFLGCAPLDDVSDVTVLNGNHGRYSYLATDGLYLDETFRDVRMGGSLDDQWVGGEPFGGFFARTKDGRFYLQTGGGGYRIYEILGLDKLKRQTGGIEVSAAQILAAERRRLEARSSARAVRSGTIGAPPSNVKIDGRLGEWNNTPPLSWDRQGQFPAKAWIAVDATTLYLAYDVRDASPWVNRGLDWQTLFKTGDSVDLQLGANPAADPKRRNPVPGDFRLLIAPFGDETIAVVYRHRLDGDAGRPVTFTSPWRSETVDDVRRIADATIAVQRGNGHYWIEAAIPLAELGWQPRAGTICRGDVGVIYGDDAGTVNLLRSYWSNDATALVNDVPGEIMLLPALWSDLRVEEGK
ncbi:MAG: FlgD immunoglobulin-like domain containing protein [Kiritimatiellia bacterium]|jgi:hypothetical protein